VFFDLIYNNCKLPSSYYCLSDGRMNGTNLYQYSQNKVIVEFKKNVIVSWLWLKENHLANTV